MLNEKIVDEVMDVVADVLEMDIDDIDLESRIVADLGADSLDIVDLSFSLGKQLNIKMPQKTVIMHAEEIFGDTHNIVESEKLTEMGAELLRLGPNQYSEDEVHQGKTLIEVFADTKVKHWVNLSQAIKESGLTGDELIQQRVQAVFSASEAA